MRKTTGDRSNLPCPSCRTLLHDAGPNDLCLGETLEYRLTCPSCGKELFVKGRWEMLLEARCPPPYKVEP